MKKFYLIALLLGMVLHASANHWEVNVNAYANTQAVVCTVEIDGVEATPGLELGAFCGDECRGSEIITDLYYQYFNQNVIFLNLTGENGHEITFRLYDHALNQELDVTCNTTVTFVADATLGDLTTGEFFLIEFTSNNPVPTTYSITTSSSPTEGGTIEGAGDYLEGAECTLTATPNPGYYFINWTLNNEEVGTNPTLVITVSENAEYVANFGIEDTGDYHWSVNISQYSNTATMLAYIKIDNVEQFNDRLELGAFCGTECRGREIASSDNFDITQHYMLFLNLHGNDGDVLTYRIYDHNLNQEIEATCLTTTTFINDNLYGSPIDPYVIEFITASTYNITATADPTAGGTVSGAGEFSIGDTCTLTATANENYSFLNWTMNGEVVSTESSFSFEVTGNAAYVAHFTMLQTYSITAAAVPTAGGTIEGAGNYLEGTECTLTATANPGYTFINWTLNGSVVSETAEFTFTVTGNEYYVANFQINNYAITVAANPTEGGTVTGGGTFAYGASCTLTATANEGYMFVKWTKNGQEVSNASTYTFSVTEAGSYVAIFEALSGDYHWNVNIYTYPNTMSIVGIVKINGVEQFNTNLEVGIFCGDECRGTEKPTDINYIPNVLPHYFLYLTPHGNDGDVMTFRLYDHGLGQEVEATCSNTVTFVNDATIGMFDDPYVIEFNTAASYNVTLVSNPTAGGTVTGGGSFLEGDECTVTATANTGYTFVNWTENGNEVSTTASYSFTVEADRNLVANFELNSYAINATADPTEGGSIEGEGFYHHFDTCTLIATANTNYAFLNWTKDGEVVASVAEFSFEVTEDADYVAHFTSQFTYTVTATANPTAGGTVLGGGNYLEGTVCTVSATANTGYTFVNWTENGTVVSTNTSYTFTVEGDIELVANFELNSYEITVAAEPAEGGIVTGGNNYNYGASCTLTATANEGYMFVNWTKNGQEVSNMYTYTFTVTEAGSYVANFEALSGDYHWYVNIYTYPNTMTVNAIVKINGVEQFNTNLEVGVFCGDECRGTERLSDAYYHPESLPHYFLFLTPHGNDGDVMTFRIYDHGIGQELQATCSNTITFVNDATLGLEEPYVIEFFTESSHTITVSANPTAGGVVTGGGSFEEGTECTVTATANTGYTFTNWTEDGTVVSTTASYTFTVEADRELVANFTPNSYTITATVDPTEAGVVTGGGTYVYGETCTLTATANENYSFLNWTLNGEQVSTEAEFTFDVTGNADYVAHFTSHFTYTINATANPTAGGIVTGAGNYLEGTECTVTATANTGYTFTNWTENGNVVFSASTYTFTVNGDRELVANFTPNTYIVNVTVNPATAGTVTGANSYQYGTECTVTATANVGFSFANWTLNGVVVSTNPEYTFTVSGNTNLTANFEESEGDYYWNVDIYEFPENMSVFAVIQIDGVEQLSTELELGAFMGESCRGRVRPTDMYYDSVTFPHYVAFLMVHGTNGDEFTFKLYDHSINEVLDLDCNTTITFNTSVDMIGSPMDPFVIDFTTRVYYDITASVNPAESGTVSGTGTFLDGSECTLTATPATGYHFVNWTLNGEVASTDANFTFTVTEAAEYVANFELNSYEITANANPEEAGSIEGAGSYNHFETCTLTATANTGYHFLNWTKGGIVVSDNTTYQFTVTEDAEYVANFEVNSYEITASVDPANAGTVSGTGSYDHFSTCTLTATPATGYHFVNWTLNGEVVGTNAQYSFEVDGPAAYVAHFELNSYEITANANPEEAGSIEGAGSYNHFETCTLTATANTGYHFLNWTKGGIVVSDNTTYQFTVTEDAEYVANFEVNSYEITASVDPANAGTVSGTGNYDHFSTCTLTATPATGYHFVNWTLDGEVVGTNAQYSFEVEGPAAYVAHFELNSYEITANANPEEAGSINGTGTYYHFETCTLTATANTGYHFLNWTKGGIVVSDNTTYQFTVTEDAEYVANFEVNSYEITASVDPTNAGTVSGTGSYDHFSTCTLTATPATGYHFVNWTLNGEVVGTNAQYSFEVEGPAAYVAHFELNSYEIVATANPTAGGIIGGAGSYYHFETCTLTATASTGYHFLNWTKGGIVVSSNTTYQFTVTEDAEYVANFEVNSYEITASVDPANAGTVSGTGSYDHFSTCTLTASPATGYHFVNWTLNGQEVSNEAEYSFEVIGAAAYVAHFELNIYEITVVAYPANGGTVTGGGNYTHGDNVTLTATPEGEFIFVNWTKNGIVVSEETEFSFTATEAGNYVANFERVTVTQNTVIHNGWNWYSTYIEQDDINGLQMLEESLGENGQKIVSQIKSVTYFPGWGWMGQLNSINNESSYRIQANATIQTSVTGPVVHPSDHPITLHNGWNWIGYPCTEPMSLNEALANLTPTQLDQVKTADKSAVYYSNFGWMGRLQTLEPGMGLLYQSKNNNNVTFTYPEPSGNAPREIEYVGHWMANRHNYPDNMTIMAVVELDNEELRSDRYEVAAFANGECRGSVPLMYVEPIDRYVAFLVLSGDEVTTLNFGLYDANSDTESFNSESFVVYSTNAVLGNPDEPFVISFRNATGVDELNKHLMVFPNPVEREGIINLGINYDETEVRVEIINALGVVVYSANATSMPASIAAPTVSGVYTLRITADGQKACYRKLVVR